MNIGKRMGLHGLEITPDNLSEYIESIFDKYESMTKSNKEYLDKLADETPFPDK